ncbi:short-chain dehydrogenase/reductase SDR [Gloeothece citriformis PCC 7424]|uniref:Short-chain dehydrogenase/reductase SDR n=1 Tax=Gloeothece citriformis (strain PCC 7424) TaxID=65393 RepID=B7KD88_GLOC7|nr:3-hydroxybutyrate dehydrogenase [Gloeothece citriformis]ACK68908.1 short-chain dehydrogenase/reductase SDR [Gloeothece citriformis PCC 7424]
MTRVALITGAASGIGRACAAKFAQQNIKVVIVDFQADQGQQVAQELQGFFVQADLTQPEDCRQAIDKTVEQYGQLDILVNNAGFQHIDTVADFPEETWHKMIALMLNAPFLLTKYAWYYLIKSGQGRIVNIGSVHSLTASPFKVGYVTAKHGLVGLTKVVALEGGEHGLTCNLVCPSYVRTPLVEKQILDQSRTLGIAPEEVEEKVFGGKTVIKDKRLFEPEDVANYVAFLCSPEAWGITGAMQVMDMAWTAH